MNEEYITKSAAIEAACNAVELFPSEYREIENAINRVATDVAPVVHGQKLRPRRRSSKCCCDDSTCNGGVIRNTNQRYPNGLYPICPHCGAKLDIKRCLRRNSDDAHIRRYY